MRHSSHPLPRLAAAAAALSLFVTACGGGGAGGQTASGPPPYRPRGTLLVETLGFQTHLSAYRFPSGPAAGFARPNEAGFFQNFHGAFPGPNGSAYVLLQVQFGPRGKSLLFRVSQSSSPALGPLLDIPFGGTLDVRGDRAIAWGCSGHRRSIFAIDLMAPRQWTAVAQGCAAALSPDGTALAYVDHGILFRKTLPGGSPTRLLALGSVAGLRDAGITEFPEDVMQVAWGQGGIAMSVGRELRWALVVYRAGHEPIVTPLGGAGVARMEWQPNGALVAFSDYLTSTQTAELRVLDPATATFSEVAVTQNYGQFTWSPDGKVIAVARSGELVSFVDLRGVVQITKSMGGVPVGWTA